MKLLTTNIIAILGATAALAAPAANPNKGCTLEPITEAKILAIAPNSNTCTGATYPSECRTAAQAAPAITASFRKYGISHPAVQAALISLMAYETADFKYDVNHFPAPGRPGQGTRNEQMANFNVEYAAFLGLQDRLGGDRVTRLTDVLNSNDEWSFGSAAWFVVTKCPLTTRQAMWGGDQAGWEEYLTGCVGATVDDQRKAYWQRAIKTLGSA